MNTDNTLGSAIRYITKVLMSCQTVEQLDCSYQWGAAVIANKAKLQKGDKAAVKKILSIVGYALSGLYSDLRSVL